MMLAAAGWHEAETEQREPFTPLKQGAGIGSPDTHFCVGFGYRGRPLSTALESTTASAERGIRVDKGSAFYGRAMEGYGSRTKLNFIALCRATASRTRENDSSARADCFRLGIDRIVSSWKPMTRTH